MAKETGAIISDIAEGDSRSGNGKETMLVVISLLLYKIALDISYYFIVSDVWGYRLIRLDVNYIKVVESYLLLVLVAVLLPRTKERLSKIFVWLLILLSYVPMLTYYSLANENRSFTYAVTIFWLVIIWFCRIPVSVPPLKKHSKSTVYFIVFLFLLITFVGIYFFFGLPSLFSLQTEQVYRVRFLYRETQAPFAFIYLFGWVALILNPAMFIYSIIKRKGVLAVVILVLQVLLFSATGHKTYVFVLPFAAVLAWLIMRKRPLAIMGLGLAAIITIGMVSYWLADNVWIIDLVTRRTLVVPSQLSFQYFEYFSKNEPVYLSDSIFRHIFSYPYAYSPPHLIGSVFYNNPAMSANTGVVGNAYMNFRFFGLAIYGLILMGVIRLIDRMSVQVDLRIGVAVVAAPAIALTNSALHTSLLTHGVLFSLLLLYIFPRQG